MARLNSRGIFSRLFLVLLCFHAGGFLFFTVRSAVIFRPAEYLPIFFTQWTLINGTIEYVRNMMTIQVTGAIVFFSLIFTSRKRAGTLNVPSFFHSVAASSIVLLLVFAFIYAGMAEGAKPVLLSKISSMKDRTELARGLLEDAKTYKASGEYERGMEAVRGYLRIDPKNEKAQKLSRDLLKDYSNFLKKQTSGVEKEERQGIPSSGYTVEELTARAETYFLAEDYSSSHYFASLALALDPGNMKAKAFAARSLEKLSRAGINREDESQADKFYKKKQGYDALQNNDIVKAYYHFTRLALEYPEDEDIRKYLELTKQRLTNISFFRDEINEIQHLPGSRNILFLNSLEEGHVEIISMGKVIYLQEGTYVMDIEAIRLDRLFRTVYHLQAPYGKVIDSMLNMQCIDRNDPSKNLLPEYLSGSRPEDLSHVLTLNAVPEDIQYLNPNFRGLEEISIPRLWALAKVFESRGYRSEPLIAECIIRAVNIFSFFILSLFAVSLGWMFRPGMKKSPTLAFIFIPAFPFALHYLVLLYNQMNRILVSFFYLLTGFLPAVGILIIIQVILAAAALVVLAGQSTERE